MNDLLIKTEIENFITKSEIMSRKISYLQLFEYVFKNRNIRDFNIVETGTLRGVLAEAIPGDGGSTCLWGFFCKLTGNKCYTVDILPDAIENCRKWTQEYKESINYVVSDSVSFLENFNDRIDLLFLDSFDSPPQFMEQASQHQLKEIESCYDKLKPGTLILLDDAPPGLNGGKVKYSVNFLNEKGAKMLYHGDNQALFEKT